MIETFQNKQTADHQYLDGVFVKTGIITSAILEYRKSVFNGWNPSDIVLSLEVAREDVDFKKNLTIWGDFSREPTPGGEHGKISSEGSAFKVLNIFKSIRRGGWDKETGRVVNPENLNATDQDIANMLVGENVTFLEYAAVNKEGRLTYHSFDRVVIVFTGREKEAKQLLIKQFEDQWKKGYVKDYAPEEHRKAKTEGASAEESSNGNSSSAAPAKKSFILGEDESAPF